MPPKTPRKPKAAPPPAAEETAAPVMMLRVGDVTLPAPPGIDSLSYREKFAVRAATGVPAESFFPERREDIGSDTPAVWWWLARRRASGRDLAFHQIEGELAAAGGIVYLDLIEPSGPGDDPSEDDPEG